jgi:uncharacterized protein
VTEPEPFERGAVRGFLHRGSGAAADGLVLTHGAGSDCRAPLLAAVADAFSKAGVTVLRCDLPFRRDRASGPPPRGSGEADRQGLRDALAALRDEVPGRLFLGGHSYGGRMGSMLAAGEPAIAQGLLLLSYPLHPPKKPEQLRTAHFPDVRTPAVFVHGARDGFGSAAELRDAMAAIPAPATLLVVEGAGHDLKRGRFNVGPTVQALLRS